MNGHYNGVDNSAYLAHYGVLGMKWGVRKDRSSGSSRSKQSKKSRTKQKSSDLRTDYLQGNVSTAESMKRYVSWDPDSAAKDYKKIVNVNRLVGPIANSKDSGTRSKQIWNAIKNSGAKNATIESDKIIASYIAPWYRGVNAANKVRDKLWDTFDAKNPRDISEKEWSKQEAYITRYEKAQSEYTNRMADVLVGTRAECIKRGQSYQLEGSTYQRTLNDDVRLLMNISWYAKGEDD